MGFLSFGQQNELDKRSHGAVFTIRGAVYEKDSRTPYRDVEIVVNGGKYTRTGFDGTFNVQARIGDELNY